MFPAVSAVLGLSSCSILDLLGESSAVIELLSVAVLVWVGDCEVVVVLDEVVVWLVFVVNECVVVVVCDVRVSSVTDGSDTDVSDGGVGSGTYFKTFIMSHLIAAEASSCAHEIFAVGR